LQNYNASSRSRIEYLVFDCLSLNGKKITELPLIERKEILRRLLPANNIVRFCDHVIADGKNFFNAVKKNSLEGMIAKKLSSKYYEGKRTTEWLKIKNVRSEEAIIIGYTPPKGSRNFFGSLLLAQYVKGKLTYIGNVGTGFSELTLKTLFRKMERVVSDAAPVNVAIRPGKGTVWLNPVLVCNIRYTERTSAGIVRHPVFLGIREDKVAAEVQPEKAAADSPGVAKAKPNRARKTQRKTPNR
jgi:bifunctional non-homologous end joining protein LigD